MTATRRLAAILAADVVGFSRLVGADEPGTLARLAALRAETIDPLLAAHGGRVFKSMGDGLFVEFSSGVQAVQCAVAIQQALAARADALQLRIGLHSADVAVQPEGDLLGDGVNIAARIEALAEAGGICISGQVRENAAGKISLELEDLGTPPLKNIAQPVHVFRVRLDEPARPALALPDKPSLVVLPFQNMSGDPEQEHFADGMVEDITTALSRIAGLFVIARNSSFTYKGRAVDVRQVARELGVRYVLEGSVRRAGGRVRITCQLINAATGAHLWADKYDADLADLFELQDRVAESVAGAIEPTLMIAETARTLIRPTEDLNAYDLYLRAVHHYRRFTKADSEEALRLARRAIALDPHFALGKAMAAECLGHLVDFRWIAEGGPEIPEAVALAREAVADARDDPRTLSVGGLVLGRDALDVAAARVALDRALALSPNSTPVLSISAWVRCWSGDWAAARELFVRAIRLSPFDPLMRFFLVGLSEALIELGEPEAALDPIRKVVAGSRGHDYGRLQPLVHCLVVLNRMEEARDVARTMLRLDPALTLARERARSSPFSLAFREQRWTSLRAAGIPE